MNWTDLTDMLFCRVYGHLFSIKKPAFRNDVVEWYCVDEDNVVVASGKTVKLTTAKAQCKEYFKQLKANDKNIYFKPNNKLTRKRYAASKTA